MQSTERVWGGSGRLELLDSVRGFALMGLFLVHCVEQYELFWAHPDFGPVYQWVFGLFSGKSYALMGLCFGVSFYLIMRGAARRSQDYRWRFAWRLTTLMAIGLLHGLYYRGDILSVLALIGFSMLLFDRIKDNRILLLLAAILFLQIPLLLRAWAAAEGMAWAMAPPLFNDDSSLPVLASGGFAQSIHASAGAGFVGKWSFYLETGRIVELLGLFMVGLVLGRVGFFERPDEFKKTRRVVLGVALILSWLLFFHGGSLLDGAMADGAARQNLHFAVDCWTSVAMTIAELLVFVELFQAIGRPILRLLAAPGRMTLTLYVGQSIVFVPVFYGFGLGLHDDLSVAACLEIGLVSFALQAWAAHAWFRHFHYGPLEWIWRAATKTSWDVPFLKGPRTAPV